ncbi:MAG: HD domain-containing phosphohydrolase [Nitrospinota bacterium]|nr:HD domain-containing phosphohydrolase [Nitrospinota bacterium]MDP7386426.1 HD domain-containing phosphohydrolase [Nitrospinota bacterium]
MYELIGHEDDSVGIALENPTDQPEPNLDLGKLRPIQMSLVAAFPLLPFPIYIHSDSEKGYSLLVSKGSRLSENLQKKIKRQSKGSIYVQAKDYALYAAETEQTINRLLSDPKKDAREKVPLFFSFATERLDDVFRRISEEGGENAMLVLPIAEQALDLIQQDWKAAFSLLRLAQTDPRAYAHALNVCLFGLSYIHNFLPGYSECDLKEIALGFLSHDIGELVVSKDLLNQRSTLNPLERKIIQQIPLHGVNVLKEAGCDYPLAVDIVLNHHERVDGQGYPRGLFQHRIPLIAQVCAICGSFDTMTTPQPYRHGTTPPSRPSITCRETGPASSTFTFSAISSE